MRHGGGAHGALPADLLEVAQRDVGPKVGGEVVGDAAEARHIGVQLGLPVMRFDLGRERIPHQAQRFHELSRRADPVGVRPGRQVRAVGAGSAVELAEILGAFDPGELTLQSPRQHG